MFKSNHIAMAAEVRVLGPSIFAKLVADKRRCELSPLDTINVRFTSVKPYDRKDVLEVRDIYKAIAGGDFNGRELAVLKYLRNHFNRVGDRVGRVLIIAPRNGTEAPFCVIREGMLDVYNGEPHDAPGKGNVVISVFAAVYFAFGAALVGVMLGWLAAHMHVPVGAVATVCLALLCGIAGGALGYGLVMSMTADQDAARRV